jgi:putative transposase
MFRSLAHSREVPSEWRDDYSGERPNTSLNGHTPNEFARRSTSDHNQNGLQL